jgi:hypothetical protein
MTRDRRPDAAEEPGSRALVPVEAGGAEAIAPLVRPEAPFVAQLLACRDASRHSVSVGRVPWQQPPATRVLPAFRLVRSCASNASFDPQPIKRRLAAPSIRVLCDREG